MFASGDTVVVGGFEDEVVLQTIGPGRPVRNIYNQNKTVDGQHLLTLKVSV